MAAVPQNVDTAKTPKSNQAWDAKSIKWQETECRRHQVVSLIWQPPAMKPVAQLLRFGSGKQSCRQTVFCLCKELMQFRGL